MRHSGLLEVTVSARDGSSEPVDKRALTESVAYALWEARKQRGLADDPESDWYEAEELITELWNHRPPEMS